MWGNFLRLGGSLARGSLQSQLGLPCDWWRPLRYQWPSTFPNRHFIQRHALPLPEARGRLCFSCAPRLGGSREWMVKCGIFWRNSHNKHHFVSAPSCSPACLRDRRRPHGEGKIISLFASSLVPWPECAQRGGTDVPPERMSPRKFRPCTSTRRFVVDRTWFAGFAVPVPKSSVNHELPRTPTPTKSFFFSAPPQGSSPYQTRFRISKLGQWL